MLQKVDSSYSAFSCMQPDDSLPYCINQGKTKNKPQPKELQSHVSGWLHTKGSLKIKVFLNLLVKMGSDI